MKMKRSKGLTSAFFFILALDISSTFSVDNSLKFSTDATGVNADLAIATPELPPLVFPDDPKAYRIVPPNDTALKILQHMKVTTPSIPQLEKLVSDKKGVVIFRVPNMHVDDIPEEFPTDFADNLKAQVEEIQSSDLSRPLVELEERFHQQPANLQTHDIFAEDIETNEPTLNNGHIAAILAGVLAVVCISIYFGFMSWRSYIGRQYGKRERLVNQDEYYHSNDSRPIDL